MGKTPFKPQLKALGKEIQEALPDGVAAFLFVQYSESVPLAEIWRSDGAAAGLSGDSKRLLGVCAKRQRSVLVHDAEKDILMKGIKVRTFSSALCVPVLSEDKLFLGSLLALSEEAGAFLKEHRFVLERLSRELTPVLIGSRSLPDRETERGSSSFAFLFSRAALAVFGCALLFLGMWAMAPEPKKKEVRPVVPVEAVDDRAMAACRDFLQKLRDADYDEAWNAFAPELKSRWSRADFADAFEEWAKAGKNQDILGGRKVSKMQTHLGTAQVSLLESPVEGDKGVWDWELVNMQGDWSITSMSGPISSPSKRS